MVRRLLVTLWIPLFLAACGSSATNTSTESPTTHTATASASPSRSANVFGAAGSPSATAPLYIALGDSLSVGIGASVLAPEAGFVALVHQGLDHGVGLLQLGVPGHTSQDLIDKQLDQAIGEIQRRKEDGIAGNEVKVVTL